MKLTGTTISKGMTVNLGNYNSTRVDVAMSVEFEAGDDILKDLEDLSELVTAKLRDEVQKIASPPTKKKQTLMENETAMIEGAL